MSGCSPTAKKSSDEVKYNSSMLLAFGCKCARALVTNAAKSQKHTSGVSPKSIYLLRRANTPRYLTLLILAIVRACLKRLGSSQSAQHQTSHSDVNHGFATLKKHFIVLPKLW